MKSPFDLVTSENLELVAVYASKSNKAGNGVIQGKGSYVQRASRSNLRHQQVRLPRKLKRGQPIVDCYVKVLGTPTCTIPLCPGPYQGYDLTSLTYLTS